jgi:hypothetical protein
LANKYHNTLLSVLSTGYSAPTYSTVTLSPSSPHPNPEFKSPMPRTIYSSVFRASRKLSHLTLKNCIFNHVLLRNCTIINGILHNCVLFDGEIRNSVVKKCQVIKKPLALRIFAPDIRALIFEYVIEGEATVWQVGCMPGLLKAVFGDPVLYHEAIEAMYNKAFVPLTSLGRMKPAQVHMVTKVSIDCE